LLRIETRKVSMNLDIVIISIFTLNWTDTGVLERDVTLGYSGQLDAPVDKLPGLVFFGSQLVDLGQDEFGCKALERELHSRGSRRASSDARTLSSRLRQNAIVRP
jgi:hypothetical protein